MTQEVVEGRRLAAAVTSQPKKSRTGFKFSMFGLFGSKATQEEPEEEQVPMEPSREKPMEE